MKTTNEKFYAYSTCTYFDTGVGSFSFYPYAIMPALKFSGTPVAKVYKCDACKATFDSPDGVCDNCGCLKYEVLLGLAL